MASKVDICNMALSAIGTRSTIAALTENSAEARQLSLQYPTALDAILQAAHWNFARAQKSLAVLKQVPTDTDVPQPWMYEYDYPSDCVQARYVMPIFESAPGTVPGAANVPFFTGPPIRFLVGTDLDSRGNRKKVILTNQPQAQLIYTVRIDDPSLYDANFVQALAGFLATLICIPLSGDKTLMKLAFEKSDKITKDARASNGNEGLTVADSIPDWMRARGYASDWSYPAGSFFYYGPQNLTMVQ